MFWQGFWQGLKNWQKSAIFLYFILYTNREQIKNPLFSLGIDFFLFRSIIN